MTEYEEIREPGLPSFSKMESLLYLNHQLVPGIPPPSAFESPGLPTFSLKGKSFEDGISLYGVFKQRVLPSRQTPVIYANSGIIIQSNTKDTQLERIPLVVQGQSRGVSFSLHAFDFNLRPRGLYTLHRATDGILYGNFRAVDGSGFVMHAVINPCGNYDSVPIDYPAFEQVAELRAIDDIASEAFFLSGI